MLSSTKSPRFHRQTMISPQETRVAYQFGLFRADAETGELLRKGVRVKLQEQPFRLLILLLENAGETVPRESVRQRLWPANTFVEFDASLGVAVGKLRDALGDDAENPVFIETVPRRGYRFIAPVRGNEAEPSSTLSRQPEMAAPPPTVLPRNGIRKNLLLPVSAALIVTIGLGLWYWRHVKGTQLSERASVLVGDFANLTGDPVFDGSLRQATLIELAQSPYLTVLPDSLISDTLQDLGRPPEEKLTPAIARQVCQRSSSAAVINGSIELSGSKFLLALDATRCADGASLGRESAAVASKDKVLASLGVAASSLRRKLGESRDSLKKFDVQVEQATTSSLDALKAYQLGIDFRSRNKSAEAIPEFKTAIKLDPNFAMAYAQLGSSYSSGGETQKSLAFFKKAFELRSRVTMPERFYVAGRYYDIVTGELEKASEIYKEWTETYPNEWRAFNALANDGNLLGRYELVVPAAKRAVLLAPSNFFGYSNLIDALAALNRFAEVKTVCAQAAEKGVDAGWLHLALYGVAFVEDDQASADREIRWAEQHSNIDVLYGEAEVAAARGKLKESTRRFQDIAHRDVMSSDSETAGNALAASAFINSQAGRSQEAERQSEAALKLGTNEMILGSSALVNVQAKKTSRARSLLEKLDHDYPLSVFNIGVYGPMIRASLAIARGSSAAEITNLLEPALPYELGAGANLAPIYVRGVALLRARDAEGAAREFQKLLNHRGVDAASIFLPLSQLGLGRSYKMMGKLEESRKSYGQFFALWKDADPDIPILKEAKAEYAKLQ
jgi:DNA-binding winged helix-turn-helix (wHTH) protein/tetratricopeptide (TPR) repeat protein